MINWFYRNRKPVRKPSIVDTNVLKACDDLLGPAAAGSRVPAVPGPRAKAAAGRSRGPAAPSTGHGSAQSARHTSRGAACGGARAAGPGSPDLFADDVFHYDEQADDDDFVAQKAPAGPATHPLTPAFRDALAQNEGIVTAHEPIVQLEEVAAPDDKGRTKVTLSDGHYSVPSIVGPMHRLHFRWKSMTTLLLEFNLCVKQENNGNWFVSHTHDIFILINSAFLMCFWIAHLFLNKTCCLKHLWTDAVWVCLLYSFLC